MACLAKGPKLSPQYHKKKKKKERKKERKKMGIFFSCERRASKD
jgi:hypothetical protein